WPLFRALVSTNHLHEAADLLGTDLAGDFATELPIQERAVWWGTLGELYSRRWELARAEECYHAALRISEQTGDKFSRAAVYHSLGSIAQERREFAAAEGWYRKALAIWNQLGVDLNAASTYYQLGMIAEELGDLTAAEGRYRQALAIGEKHGDERTSA